MKNLLHLSLLKGILGYSDMRSVRSWLSKNKAPLVILGRNTYVPKRFIDELIRSAVGAQYLSKEPSGDIGKNKPAEVDNPTKTGLATPRRAKTKQSKTGHSKASSRLLKNIKLG